MSIDGGSDDLKAVALKAVNKTEPECGSRMLAYAKVAAAVGVSASYLRKFITVEGTPEPKWSVGRALLKHYEKICDRVDEEVRHERAEIKKLMGELNAADRAFPDVAVPVSHTRRSTDRPQG